MMNLYNRRYGKNITIFKEEVKQSFINNKINNIKQIIITLGLQKVETILLDFLIKAFDLNYIVRGKGITNNFFYVFYVLGVACNRSNCNNNYYLNKYLD